MAQGRGSGNLDKSKKIIFRPVASLSNSVAIKHSRVIPRPPLLRNDYTFDNQECNDLQKNNCVSYCTFLAALSSFRILVVCPLV